MTTPAFLSEFGFETLRDLPDFERLEDAGLLSKVRLLAGDIPLMAAGLEADPLSPNELGDDAARF